MNINYPKFIEFNSKKSIKFILNFNKIRNKKYHLQIFRNKRFFNSTKKFLNTILKIKPGEVI